MSRVVLLVEDDDDIRGMYRVAFRAAGFETVEAPDGAAAIEFLEAQLPDAVVLDVSMPKVSGLRVIEYVRERRALPDLPIVVSTAYPYLAETTLVTGATHTMLKPLAIHKLVELIDTLTVKPDAA